MFPTIPEGSLLLARQHIDELRHEAEVARLARNPRRHRRERRVAARRRLQPANAR